MFRPNLYAQGLAEAPVIANPMPFVKISWFSVLAQSRIFSFPFPVCLESTFVAEHFIFLERGGQGIKGALNPINYVVRMIRTGGMGRFYSEPDLLDKR